MNLKLLKYAIDYLNHIIFFGIITMAISGLVIMFIFPKAMTPSFFICVCLSFFAVGAIIYTTIRLVVWLLSVERKNKKEAYLEKHGYCDEYFDKIKRKALKKQGDKKAVKQLYLARELCDGRRFDEALGVIGEIKITEVSKKVLYDYYTVYFYTLVMKGEIENAQILFGAGENYICATPLGCFSKGVYNYAKENYEEAEENLETSIKKSKNRFTKQISRLFMSLLYVKTDRKELAKKEASALCGEISNPVLKEDLKKLMLIIEREYGFNRTAVEELSEKPCEEKGEREEGYAGSID